MRNRLLMLFVQELRTPLSLIIAPLKELQKDDASDFSAFSTGGVPELTPHGGCLRPVAGSIRAGQYGIKTGSCSVFGG